MKRSLTFGVASVIALTLAIAAPAHADTVTTSTVTATTAGNVTPLFSLPALLPAGPVTFPVTVTGSGMGPAATLSPGAAAAGCSRVVNSFTIAFSAASLAGTAGLQSGNFVNGAFVDATNYTYTGDGSATQSAGIVTAIMNAAATPQAGLLTLNYPTPVPIADMFQLVAFLQPGTWSIDSADFSVTDTCPDATPAAGPTLAASGVAALPLALGGSALLAGGLVVTLLVRSRRTRSA